jgi:hypothetical protein
MVVHTCNLNIQEAKAGEFWVQGQSVLYSKTLSKKTHNKTYP